MPAIIIPSKWRTQPQYPVEIDYGNPLCAGLLGAFSPVTNYHNFINSGTAQPIGLNRYGKEWQANGSGIHYATLKRDITDFNATVLFFGTTSRGTTALMGLGNRTSGTTLSGCFQLDVNGTGNNRWFMRAGDNTGNTLREYSAKATATMTTPAVLIGVVNAITNVDVYWDGILDNGYSESAASGVPAWGYFGPASFKRGAETPTANTSGLNAMLAAVWARALSEPEIKGLSANPWQLFKPIVRRTYFYVATGGGASITSVTPSTFDDAHAGIVVAGTGFGASQGSSTVTIGGVTQTVTSWSDTSITITSETTGLSMGSATLTVTIV